MCANVCVCVYFLFRYFHSFFSFRDIFSPRNRAQQPAADLRDSGLSINSVRNAFVNFFFSFRITREKSRAAATE